MKISVITINYNDLHGLERTSESILAQDFEDFEWLIIDGGSNDGSGAFIESLAADPDASRHLRFHCSEPDGGRYPAMNKGARHASGDYVLFINSGDELYGPHALSEAAGYITGAEDICYGNCIIDWGDRRELRITAPVMNLFDMVHLGICHPSSFIRRSLLLENPYDENLTIVSDWKGWLTWMKQGKNFRHIGTTVSVFYTDGISSDAKFKDMEYAERKAVLKEFLSPFARFAAKMYSRHSSVRKFIQRFIYPEKSSPHS